MDSLDLHPTIGYLDLLLKEIKELPIDLDIKHVYGVRLRFRDKAIHNLGVSILFDPVGFFATGTKRLLGVIEIAMIGYDMDKEGDLVYISEIGYDDVQRFGTVEEVITELKRIMKELEKGI